jgi:hypothetical protein
MQLGCQKIFFPFSSERPIEEPGRIENSEYIDDVWICRLPELLERMPLIFSTMALDIYLFCMALGFLGLITMLAVGGGHGHGAAGHTHGGASPHHGGGTHPATPGGAHHAADNSAHGASCRQTLLMLLAPRVWFSLLFGFGAAGYLLHRWIGGTLLGLAAVVCACVFERWMVEPVWNFVLRFASAPAKMLDSTVLEDAVAVTNFDAQDQGLISVPLDGQIRQMLGTLHREPSEAGTRVLAGDRLTIIAVDPLRNSCTVARAGIGFNPVSRTNNP